MGKNFIPTRRDLLKTGGALIVGFSLGARAHLALAQQTAAAKPLALTAVDTFLAIDSAGAVTVYSGKVDLGTGVRTALAQIVADELDVPFASVSIVQGDTALTPDQGPTFGSLSIQIGGVQIRNAAAKARSALIELAAAQLGAKDLIATEGTPSTLAAIRATTTIPIVFGSTQDPIEKGIVTSLAHPGGNVTGNALIADHSKPLELLKEAVPGVSQVMFIYDPATRPGAYGQAKLRELQNHARTVGMVVNAIALSDPEETNRVFAALPKSADAILLENSTINLLAQERLCTLATQRRLPSVSTLGEFAEAGCLMSYGENLPDVYRRAASYVDKIFKGGKPPADLPVQQAVTFQLIINLRTAKALNLTLPELVLVRADKIIE
jgi:putative tryptophan/tyrosine transport system substrate-binding protein